MIKKHDENTSKLHLKVDDGELSLESGKAVNGQFEIEFNDKQQTISKEEIINNIGCVNLIVNNQIYSFDSLNVKDKNEIKKYISIVALSELRRYLED